MYHREIPLKVSSQLKSIKNCADSHTVITQTQRRCNDIVNLIDSLPCYQVYLFQTVMSAQSNLYLKIRYMGCYDDACQENILQPTNDQNMRNVGSEMLAIDPQITQLLSFYWNSHIEKQSMGQLRNAGGVTCLITDHRSLKRECFSTLFEDTSYLSTWPLVLKGRRGSVRLTLTATHSQQHTYLQRQFSSMSGVSTAFWLLPRIIADFQERYLSQSHCSIESLSGTRQLNKKENNSLGNSTPLISTPRGDGCIISHQTLYVWI